MRALVIAPHPDDEAIGCGGAIVQHAERGDQVDVAFLTSGELALDHVPAADAWEVREAEARAAGAVLGVSDMTFLRRPDWFLEEHVESTIADVAALIEGHGADLVYVPHEAEWHPDHRAAFAIGLEAAVRCGLAATSVLRYEVWTPLAVFDVIEDVTEQMARKIDAIERYPSQLRTFDYVQAARGLAHY